MTVSAVDWKAASARVSQSLATPGATANKAAATTAKDTTTTSSSSSTGDITSNDFLALLVTEMKNQDPTQPTDPNAYIQQLVGVNSLQQLISINQELGAATTGATASLSNLASQTSTTSAATVAATSAVNNN